MGSFRSAGNRVPVVVMTGYSEAVGEVESEAVTVLQKPFTREAALASLSSVIELIVLAAATCTTGRGFASLRAGLL